MRLLQFLARHLLGSCGPCFCRGSIWYGSLATSFWCRQNFRPVSGEPVSPPVSGVAPPGVARVASEAVSDVALVSGEAASGVTHVS
jgi:hypothetical protein